MDAQIDPAALCLACAAAEHIGPLTAPNAPGPEQGWAWPPAPLTKDWTLGGWLTADDSVLGVSVGRVFYGWLLLSETDALIVVRGTGDAAEWAIDSEGWPVPYPLGGMVEAGFYSVAQAIELVTSGGSEPAVPGIAAVVGTRNVTVTGHSLGAAIATYLTLELDELLPGKVRGRYFESPRPGDATFAAFFDARIADYMVWRYVNDVVPDLPPDWLGYASLPRVTVLPANPAICDTPACNHHAQNIAHLIDPSCAEIVSGCVAG